MLRANFSEGRLWSQMDFGAPPARKQTSAVAPESYRVGSAASVFICVHLWLNLLSLLRGFAPRPMRSIVPIA
jgi:hypothetical protein